MKRCYQVKLFDMARPFAMIMLEFDCTPEHAAKCVFGEERVEWVR